MNVKYLDTLVGPDDCNFNLLYETIISYVSYIVNYSEAAPIYSTDKITLETTSFDEASTGFNIKCTFNDSHMFIASQCISSRVYATKENPEEGLRFVYPHSLDELIRIMVAGDCDCEPWEVN